jgi:hypothetical protein
MLAATKIYDYNTVPALLSAYGYFYDRIKHSVESDDLDDEFAPSPEVSEDENDTEAAREAAKADEIKLARCHLAGAA